MLKVAFQITCTFNPIYSQTSLTTASSEVSSASITPAGKLHYSPLRYFITVATLGIKIGLDLNFPVK